MDTHKHVMPSHFVPGTTVAYILKGYPRTSETFIANEMLFLEEAGLRLRVFSLIRPNAHTPHGVFKKIHTPVSYAPEAGSLQGVGLLRWFKDHASLYTDDHYWLIGHHPLRYLSALTTAVAWGIRYRRRFLSLRKKIIKDLLRSAGIARKVLEAGDVGHLHGHFCGSATTVTFFVSCMTGIPYSFTAHAKDIYQRGQNPGDLLARKILHARFVVTCTAANRDYLQRLAPTDHIISLIYHGIDTELFRPAASNAAKQATPLILAVGRLIEKKGFEYLIRACGRLRDRRFNFRCQIIGDDGGGRERIEKLIERLDLRNQVELLGPITQEQLATRYAQATVFALPSQVLDDGDRDGIPNVLVEAQAMGLPVISSAISGIPELIEDGVSGLLVPARDADALARALAKLLDDKALAARFAVRGRDCVGRHFDARESSKCLQALFTQVLGAVQESNHSSPACSARRVEPT